MNVNKIPINKCKCGRVKWWYKYECSKCFSSYRTAHNFAVSRTIAKVVQEKGL